EALRAEATVQQQFATETSSGRVAVDFRDTCRSFRLESSAFSGAVRAVSRLDCQFADTLQVVGGLVQRAFSHLGDRDTVVSVTYCLVQATDLRREAVADRKASSVIFCAVNTEAG